MQGFNRNEPNATYSAEREKERNNRDKKFFEVAVSKLEVVRKKNLRNGLSPLEWTPEEVMFVTDAHLRLMQRASEGAEPGYRIRILSIKGVPYENSRAILMPTVTPESLLQKMQAQLDALASDAAKQKTEMEKLRAQNESLKSETHTHEHTHEPEKRKGGRPKLSHSEDLNLEPNLNKND